MEIEGVRSMVEEFEGRLSEFSSTTIFVPESLRLAWFPQVDNPDYVPIDEEEDRKIREFGMIARNFWTGLLERVRLANESLIRDNVPSDVIRPIMKLEWKTTIIPQSSMVFFRYMNQMGYRTRFKFSPPSSTISRLIPPEVEKQILERVNAYVEVSGPVEKIRLPDLISHIQEVFPDINLARGTPTYNVIQGHLKQFLP
jgi:hypothetical protein